MASRQRRDRQRADDEPIALDDLGDIAARRLADRPAETARHDDQRMPRDGREGGRIEMIRMPVGDDDDVDAFEVAGVGERTMALERAEARPEERVGQHPDAGHLQQHGGVAEEPHVQRRRSRPGRSISRRRAIPPR